MTAKTTPFSALADTHISYKGKWVHFKGRPRTFTDMNGKSFTLPSGSYGYCYQVNGATLYVAFKESQQLPPLKSASFANWSYHLTIRPHYDTSWEIELSAGV